MRLAALAVVVMAGLTNAGCNDSSGAAASPSRGACLLTFSPSSSQGGGTSCIDGTTEAECGARVDGFLIIRSNWQPGGHC
jgi:hypothetical protein